MRLVLLHYHIFKNAGTTIDDILDHSFGERFSPMDEPALEQPISNAELLSHLERHPKLSAVSSHQIRHPLPEAPGYLFFDICFLRDPLERLRSTYDYYRLKPDPSNPMSGLALRTSLGDFMAEMIRDFSLYVRNVQVNLIACLGDSDEPEEQDLCRATERIQQSSFLGVVDRFDESVIAGEYALRRVFPELDCVRPPANVSRGFEGTVAERVEQLREACKPEVYEELLRLNALDFQLVERARAEVRRRFLAVPGHEERRKELAARRARSRAPVSAVPQARRAALHQQAEPKAFTILTRAAKLAPYLRALGGNARKIFFDADYYRRNCPEAGAGELRPFLHFLLRGAYSGIPPHPLFDPAFYLGKYPDVADAGVNPLAHYVKHGAREGRQPHPLFDPAFYLERSPDVRNAGLNPLAHYIRDGAVEGRKPHPLFDPEHYRKSARLALPQTGGLVYHFLEQGPEAASPHALFDCAAWMEAHPQAASQGLNPLVAHLASVEPAAPPPAAAVTLEISDVRAAALLEGSGRMIWIAEPQQLPFLGAIQPAQVRAQMAPDAR